MAVPFVSRLMSAISGPTTGPISLSTAPESVVSLTERNHIISRISATKPSVGMSAPNGSQREVGLTDYFGKISRDLASKRLDYEEIVRMAPEVGQAEAIIVPSILSPNDNNTHSYMITCEADVEAYQNNEISDLVRDHLEEKLKVSRQLPTWISKALYRAGAHVMITIPVSELDRQFNDKAHRSGSVEALNEKEWSSLESLTHTSLFGLQAPSKYSPSVEQLTISKRFDENFKSSLPALESNVIDILNAVYDDPKKKAQNLDDKSKSVSSWIKSITSTETIDIADNPDLLKLKKLAQTVTNDTIKKKMTGYYNTADFVDLEVPDPEKSLGNPLVIDNVPMEAMIPLFVPGSPSEHIGYFALIDEHGEFVGAETMRNMQTIASRAFDAPRNDIQVLFTSFGYGTGYGSGNSDPHHTAMVGAYQTVMQSFLKEKLSSAGFRNIDVGSDNAVYKCMLGRYLSARRTRLLFIPKSMVTYLTYEYNSATGCGVSALEAAQFVLSLRITLLVCRSLTALNNSIDRRKIDIQVPNEYRGNRAALAEMVKAEYIRKNNLSFSTDPNELVRGIANKGLSVSVKGGNGGDQDIDIQHSPNERNSIQIDDALMEDVKNLLFATFHVPPAAVNALGEQEYSRSILSQHLILNNYISVTQDITCSILTDFVRYYIRNSAELRTKIADILNKNTSNVSIVSKATEDTTSLDSTDIETEDPKSNTVTEPTSTLIQDVEVPEATVTTQTKDEKIDVSRLLLSVIEKISFDLPRPNVAPEKAQFENLNEYISSIEQLVNAVFSDDLMSGNQESSDALAAVRASVRHRCITTYIHRAGLSDLIDVAEFKPADHTHALNSRQAIINVKASFTSMEKATKSDSNENSF